MWGEMRDQRFKPLITLSSRSSGFETQNPEITRLDTSSPPRHRFTYAKTCKHKHEFSKCFVMLFTTIFLTSKYLPISEIWVKQNFPKMHNQNFQNKWKQFLFSNACGHKFVSVSFYFLRFLEKNPSFHKIGAVFQNLKKNEILKKFKMGDITHAIIISYYSFSI